MTLSSQFCDWNSWVEFCMPKSSSADKPRSTFGARVSIWTAIVWHVLRGAFILLLFFPFLTRDAKSTHIRQWSTRLLVIFGVELQVAGLEWLSQSPRLFVANHISWLDIHVINACEPMRFVAKSEVAD